MGPKNRNTPIGRFGLFRPARDRCIARLTLLIARSCPIIPSDISSFIFSSFWPSDWATFRTGIRVTIDTTSAILSSVTRMGLDASFICQSFWRFFSLSTSFCSVSRRLAASSNFCAITTESFFDRTFSISSSRSITS